MLSERTGRPEKVHLRFAVCLSQPGLLQNCSAMPSQLALVLATVGRAVRS